MVTLAPAGYRYAHCICCYQDGCNLFKLDGVFHNSSCPSCDERTLVPMPGIGAVSIENDALTDDQVRLLRQRRGVPHGPDVSQAVRDAIRDSGIPKLYPPQEEAMGHVLAKENVVVAVPTSAGKSIIGYAALLRAVLSGGTGVYLCPLRALAKEKLDDLARFAHLGVRVALRTGDSRQDHDLRDLGDKNVLVATNEALDAMLRNRNRWVETVSVVVADEVHMMDDPSRGSVLEVALTHIRHGNPNAQVVALSGTIGNAEEVAKWLGAKLVKSDFRPSTLYRGTCVRAPRKRKKSGHEDYDDEEEVGSYTANADFDPEGNAGLEHPDREGLPPGDEEMQLVRSILAEGGQALIFVNSRPQCASTALRMAKVTQEILTHEEREALSSEVERAGDLDEDSTEREKLVEAVLKGAAYHNASLDADDRAMVERLFKARTLKVVVATPTLAQGINLPARLVIVRSHYRWSPEGRTPISVNEVNQMCGRAGRPIYDSYGEAVLLSSDESESEELNDRYFLSDPEPIVSHLDEGYVLHHHTLGLIVMGGGKTEADILAFFRRTFYGFTSQGSLDETVGEALDFLLRHAFTTQDEKGRFHATRFGYEMARLYIDPATAVILREGVRHLPPAPEAGDITPLFTVLASTAALQTVVRGRTVEAGKALALYRSAEAEGKLLLKAEDPVAGEVLPGEVGIGIAVAAATILRRWIDEVPKREVGLTPGDLSLLTTGADHLLEAMARIAHLERPGDKPFLSFLSELDWRTEMGVTRQLLPLVVVKGVGRFYARALYGEGILTAASLATSEVGNVARILRNARAAADEQRHGKGKLKPRPLRLKLAAKLIENAKTPYRVSFLS